MEKLLALGGEVLGDDHMLRDKNAVELLQQERFDTLPLLGIERVGHCLDAQTGHFAHVRCLDLEPQQIMGQIMLLRLVVRFDAVPIMRELKAQLIPFRRYKPVVDQGLQ